MIARRPSGRQAAAIAIVIVAIGALTVGDVLRTSPTTEPAPTASAGQPSTAPSPSSAADWAPIELAPLEPVATLEPSSRDDAGVSPDATFTLASLEDETARSLAERLEIAPATEFTVEASGDPATATVRPSAPLTGGDTYRFTLRSPDGAVAASWAFRVRGPVTVTGTIPGDATISVPVRTGIEVTFDQEGVADMADHFSIEPAVTGTFERHGRTQVFVPSSLAPATTYTVTVREGLARTGTDLHLPADVVFRFETEGPQREEARLQFGREVLESGPDEAAVVAIQSIRPWLESGRPPAPTSAAVRIYRFATLEAASTALEEFLAAPRWTQYADPSIPTDGLALVARFTAPLEPLLDDALLLRLPDPLDEGWYVLELQGERPAQAFLQITPVSAWVSVLDDRTAVWTNDVQTHRAIEGATVAVEGGARFAVSGADGLAVANTPSALRPAVETDSAGYRPQMLRVTSPGGHVLLVPFDVRFDGATYRGEWWEDWAAADETWWAMLNTDRSLYRRTDRVEVWGYLRHRDDGRVPASAELRLVAGGGDRSPDEPALARVVVQPVADGAFTAALPIEGMAVGIYEVQMLVDGRVVASRWLEVSIIRKPAYQLELTPDHTAVIEGSPVAWAIEATFFDGTPVASLEVELAGDESDFTARRATTDALGRATITVDAPAGHGRDLDWWWTQVHPVGPESAEISSSATVIVLPSTSHLASTAVVTGSRLAIGGRVSEVDLAKVERQIAAGEWEIEPAGEPIVGATVRVTVSELVPTRTQVGSEYDFIEKVVRPVYDYEYRRDPVRALTLESTAGGEIAAVIDIPDADHQYEVEFVTRDRAGRSYETTLWARREGSGDETSGIAFVTGDGKVPDQVDYGIGDRVDWRMVDDGRALPSGGDNRYLYLVAQRGLRTATVTQAPRFTRTFAAADAPGVFIIGVRFTGTTYAPKAAAWADFDSAEREIRVEVSSDRERYRPGETATLTVRTSRSDGSPVAATVVLQAVDEKLYAIGGAEVPTPLDDLYRRVDSGILRLTASHQVPTMSGREGEGGDTTGGGRADFRDTLLFRQLRTDATGRGAAAVRLSDDLTSWHVTASAVTAGLEAGAGELLVPVGLPFFVELTLTDTYQVADRPVLGVRAFGEALRAGDAVEFTVESPSLGLAETRLEGTAFESVAVPLPSLALGTHAITVTGVAPERLDAAGDPLTDGLTRTFDVVSSRFSAVEATYRELGEGLPAVPDGADASSWTFADAGRGQVVPLLSGLASPAGIRLDRAIAQSIAHDLLVGAFGRDPATLAPADTDFARYRLGIDAGDEDGPIRAGLALLPYGGLDPWLAARVAVLAPTALPPRELRETLAAIAELPTTRRDLQIAALAGLAALGEPVLGDLQEAQRQANLTTDERLYLALGFEAVGDDAAALAIERDLLGRYGEQLGSWVRLRLDPTADGADSTALLAVIAAGLGDPLAARMAEYAWANPAPDTVNALEFATFAVRWIERTPSSAASFAYTVDGKRTVIRLDPGDAFTLRLSAAQAASLSVETLSGSVAAVVEARVPVSPASLHPHPDVRLTRTGPPQPIATDRIVEVSLSATFGTQAPDGCYDVVELVPSGLAPLAVSWGLSDDEGVTWPSSVAGQEVRFCAFNDEETGHGAQLRYAARVVNAGTFTWEPAVMQLSNAPEMLAITPAGTATIGQP